MGQAVSSPIPADSFKSFVNLTKNDISSLWTSYNLHGEGWSLGKDEMISVVREATVLERNHAFSEDQLSSLFELFDTDLNGMVDALELCATLALTSGMDTVDKIVFVFSAFDFDSRGSLSYDEVMLLLRSVVKGLGKFSPLSIIFNSAVNDASVKQYATLIFNSSVKSTTNERVSVDEFKKYCSSHPVFSSWLKSLASFPPLVQDASSEEKEEIDFKPHPIYNTLSSVPKALYPAAMSSVVSQKEFAEILEMVKARAQVAPLPPAPAIQVDAEGEGENNGDGDDEDADADAPDAEQTEAEDNGETTDAPEEEVKADEALQPEAPAQDTAPVVEVALTFQAPWMPKADLSVPEELPQRREDVPEDLIERAWLHGVSSSASYFSFDQIVMSEEEVATTIVNNVTLFACANVFIAMKKSEESGWNQAHFTEHSNAISCLKVVNSKNLAFTADCAMESAEDTEATIVKWDLSSFAAGGDIASVVKKMVVPSGVRLLDCNSTGKQLLIALADTAQTIMIMDTEIGLCTFAKGLATPTFPSVLDVKFAASSSVFAVAGGTAGVKFFVDEQSSFMGEGAMKIYEERLGLLQAPELAGTDSSITIFSRFELLDEMVAGTDEGQVLLWNGRTCTIAVSAHQAAVTALAFCERNATLVSAAADGSVSIFKAVNPKPVAGKGPKLIVPRTLEVLASFDILGLNVCSFDIRSLSLPVDGDRALITTATREIVEVSCRIPPAEGAVPAAGDGEEEAAAEEEPGEDGIPVASGKLGDDLNGGPILVGHFLPSSSPSMSSVVNGLCQIPGGFNGFASCGTDGTVRLWQSTGGESTETQHKILKQEKLDCGCKTVTASATHLAVALDSTLDASCANAERHGSIQIFNLPDLTFAVELKEEVPCAVNDLKISPEGNLLAAALENGNISIYGQTEGAWDLKGKIVNPSADVNASPSCVDFSADGQFIRCAYFESQELRVFDLVTAFGKEVSIVEPPPPPPVVGEDGEEPEPLPVSPIVELMRSIAWATHSCPYSWETKGLPAVYCASLQLGASLCASAFDRFNHIFLSALSDGTVAVDRVPVAPGAGAPLTSATATSSIQKALMAHLGKVSAVAFIEEGAKLVTAGAFDGAISVWRITLDAEEYEPDVIEGEEEEEGGGAAADEDDEDEEGAKALPVLYDSGEDEDLHDSLRLKEHLSTARSGDNSDNITAWASGLGLTKDNLPREAAQALAASTPLIPNEELDVEWIYGCAARVTRAGVRYTAEGTVVYPAGTVSVMYDKVKHRQRYSMAHCDEITALAVHVGRGLAVTAHKGAGSIFAAVWRTCDSSITRYLDCGPVSGVSAVCFSDNAKYVAAACQDADHSVKLFEVETGKCVSEVKGGRKKILCLSFSAASANPAANSLASVRIFQGGIGHFRLLSFQPAASTLVYKTGGYGAGVKKTNVLCVSAVPLSLGTVDEPASGTEFLTGMSDGSIGMVAIGETRISAFTPVHKGALTALYVVKLKDATADDPPTYSVLSAGVDGTIKVLDMELQPTAEFNLYKTDYGLHPLGRLRGFKSVCCDKLNRKILFATAAGEIGELDIEKGTDLNAGPLVSGHFKDQLHGLCTHPLRQECLTAGDDKTLRIWNLEKKKMTTMIELPDVARAATYAPNGQIVVAGLGGEVPGEGRPRPREFNGAVVIISYLQGTLRIVHTTTDAADAISSVIFTPDGSTLLASSLDGSIYVYDALNNFQLLQTMSEHTEGIKALDISEDGKYLVSTSVSGAEMLVWDLSVFASITGEEQKFDILVTIGMKWFVREGVCGLSSVGIFPPSTKCADVLSLSQSKDYSLLATGDNYGALRLYRNPCTEFDSAHKQFHAHSPGGVSKVGFTVEDQFVLSSGRFDRMLVQWKVVRSGEIPDIAPVSSVKRTTDEVAESGTFAESFVVEAVDMSREEVSNKAALPLQAFLKGIVGSGMCFKRALSLPQALYCGQGEILSSFGKIPACLELGSDGSVKHRPWLMPDYYAPFTASAVSALAVSSDGRFVAVGNAAAGARGGQLLLLAAPTGRLVNELSAGIDGGVLRTTFSRDGKRVACIAGDKYHSLHVFVSHDGTWADGALLYSGPVSVANIDLVTFLTKPPEDSAAPFDLVTAGAGHLKFWRIKGRNLLAVCGDYQSDKMTLPAITALDCLSCTGQAVTGDTSGAVHLWSLDGKRQTMLGSHAGRVSALNCYSRTEDKIISAAADSVKIWNAAGEVLQEYPVSSILSSWASGSSIYVEDATNAIPNDGNYVTSISTDAACKRLLLSFSTSPVVSLSTDAGTSERILEGHSAPVIDLVAHPSDSGAVITICEDRVLRVWDVSKTTLQGYSSSGISGANNLTGIPTPQLTGAVSLDHAPSAAAFLNDNMIIVAVTGSDTDGASGALLLLSYAQTELVVLRKISNVGTGTLLHLKVFSQGIYIAAASSDGCVYIYQMASADPDAFKPVGYLVGALPVFGVDFSTDARFVRTFSRAKPSGAAADVKTEVAFFDFEASPAGGAATPAGAKSGGMSKQAAGRVLDPGLIASTLKTAQWESVSSAAAPEVKGAAYLLSGADGRANDGAEGAILTPPVHLALSARKSLVSAGYADGTVRVFRYPVPGAVAADEDQQRSVLPLSVHDAGDVLSTFTAKRSRSGLAQLVSVSKADGTMMVWNIEE